jgi:hypothetical protein
VLLVQLVQTLHSLARKVNKMKAAITGLCESIIDDAGAIGVQAEALTDASIPGCEAVLHLRDAQRAINSAKDALRLAIAQRKPGTVQGTLDDDDAA